MKNRKYILVYFLIIQIVVIRIVAFFPEFIEKYYSNGWYKFTSHLSRKILGSIGFSVGDIIYGIDIRYLIYQFIKNRKNITYKTSFIGILNVISIFYFLFHLLG